MGLIELFRKKEKQITPELFCGVNIGRIPRERNELLKWFVEEHAFVPPLRYAPSIIHPAVYSALYRNFGEIRERKISEHKLNIFAISMLNKGLDTFLKEDFCLRARFKKLARINDYFVYIGQRTSQDDSLPEVVDIRLLHRHLDEGIANSKYFHGCKVNGERKRKWPDYTFFNVEQTSGLRQDSSELIARLKRVGLDVKPEELGFYGVVALD